MKNNVRIPIILKEIEQLWEKYPDLRLGQLLSLIGATKTGSKSHIFYLEDEELFAKVREIRRDTAGNTGIESSAAS